MTSDVAGLEVVMESKKIVDIFPLLHTPCASRLWPVLMKAILEWWGRYLYFVHAVSRKTGEILWYSVGIGPLRSCSASDAHRARSGGLPHVWSLRSIQSPIGPIIEPIAGFRL